MSSRLSSKDFSALYELLFSQRDAPEVKFRACTFKSLLRKSGYSEKASNEVWKWYRTPPKKKSKAVKNWRS
jgi:hypothetical protein